LIFLLLLQELSPEITLLHNLALYPSTAAAIWKRYGIPFAIVPSLQPLKYIDGNVIGEFFTQQVEGKILGAILPENFNDAIAIILSEGASGFASGIALTLVAIAVGNKNFNDTMLNSAGTSGFYFATRSSIYTIGEIIGMSTPLIDAFILVLPIFFSEIFKLRARQISLQQTRVGKGPKMFDLMRFANPKMKDLMKFRETEKAINSEP